MLRMPVFICRNSNRCNRHQGSILGGITDFVANTFDIPANAADGIAGSQQAETKHKQQQSQWAFHFGHPQVDWRALCCTSGQFPDVLPGMVPGNSARQTYSARARVAALYAATHTRRAGCRFMLRRLQQRTCCNGV
jgi:hypothetical protein